MQAKATYIVEQNEAQERFATREDACDHLDRLYQRAELDVWVLRDDGIRRGWFWRLLGFRAEVLTPCFHLAKARDMASLTFLDDAWSEYRASDPGNPVDAGDEVLRKISGGEPTPVEPDYCLSAARALAAGKHFLLQGERPEWLTYRYVR